MHSALGVEKFKKMGSHSQQMQTGEGDGDDGFRGEKALALNLGLGKTFAQGSQSGLGISIAPTADQSQSGPEFGRLQRIQTAQFPGAAGFEIFQQVVPMGGQGVEQQGEKGWMPDGDQAQFLAARQVQQGLEME